MNDDLRRMVDVMSGEDVAKLAVAVQQELADPASDEAWARLSSDQAQALLDRLAEIEGARRTAADPNDVEAVSRAFLGALLDTEAFDDVVAGNALSTGVRFSFKDVVGWFQGSFNLASLLGISFEYVAENKVVTQTESGSVEKTRTIRVAVGGG
jgi:hypothetical protein